MRATLWSLSRLVGVGLGWVTIDIRLGDPALKVVEGIPVRDVIHFESKVCTCVLARASGEKERTV